jgi:hypothetical protein
MAQDNSKIFKKGGDEKNKKQPNLFLDVEGQVVLRLLNGQPTLFVGDSTSFQIDAKIAGSTWVVTLPDKTTHTFDPASAVVKVSFSLINYFFVARIELSETNFVKLFLKGQKPVEKLTTGTGLTLLLTPPKK